MKNTLVTGRKFRFYGQVTGTFLSPQMTSPAYEPYVEGKELDSLVPIYPLTAGISCKMISRLVKSALDCYFGVESLPKDIIEKYSLMPLYDALYAIHFPSDGEKMKAARKRLAFEELLNFQLRLRALKDRNRKGKAIKLYRPDMQPFFDSLSFGLTDAQKNSIENILYDL